MKVKFGAKLSKEIRERSEATGRAVIDIVAGAVRREVDGTNAQQDWGTRKYAAQLEYCINKYQMDINELEQLPSVIGLGPSPHKPSAAKVCQESGGGQPAKADGGLLL